MLFGIFVYLGKGNRISDYSNGTGKINRGHFAIVPRPDTDTNPYADEPRFHSQKEYDDYIKWRD